MADSEGCSIVGAGHLISDFLDDGVLVIRRPVLFLYEVVHLYLNILNVVLRLFSLRLHLTLQLLEVSSHLHELLLHLS